MTRLLNTCAAVLVLASGCDSGSNPNHERVSSGSARTSDSTQSAASARSSDDAQSVESDEGLLTQVLGFVMSNPRKEKGGFTGAACSSEQDHSGRSRPFHSVSIDNGNDFSTDTESFATSTPGSQTPYRAYATWDPCSLYLGLTGSAVGAGDCKGPDCAVEDRPESPYRYWLVYIDTDPQGGAGTFEPKKLGPVPDRLPIKADYLLEVRLDGVTTQTGDGYTYQGNSQLYTRSSDWRVGLEDSWRPVDRDALTVGDNSSSNFIELSVARQALGDPCAINVVGWVADTQADRAFAYWPPPRRTAIDSLETDLVLDRYGFMLLPDQKPSAMGNLNRSDFSAAVEECGDVNPPQE